MPRTSRKNSTASTKVLEIPNRQAYRVGAYVRLSAEDKRKEGDSIETQKAIINTFIDEQEGFELLETYIDSGLSGQSFERPGFSRMLADMESGKINCCITKDLSRIGRNAIDTGYYIEKHFPTHDIRFIAINDSYDSANGSSGGIVVSLKNLINETYALDIGRKTSATKQLQIREGAFIGKVPPYGYMKNPENKRKLSRDEETAPIVVQIYDMFMAGSSIREITDELNKQQTLPPLLYFHSKGWASDKDLRRNSCWNRSAVTGILKNQVYCGDMVQGKRGVVNGVKNKDLPKNQWVIVENTHSPLINRDVYFKIQDVLAENILKRTPSRFSTPASENIFLGKLVCGHCGYAMSRRRSYENTYQFACISKHNMGKHVCGSVRISEKKLRTMLMAMLEKQAEVFADKQKIQNFSQPQEKLKSEMLDIQAKIERNQGFLKGLYESLMTGDITADEYKELKTSYESKLEALANQERQLRIEIVKQRTAESVCQRANSTISVFRGIEDLTSAALDILIEQICIFESNQLQVHFKFANETEGGDE